MGIHGICHSAYVIEENEAAKELYVTQNINIKNCHQKAEIYQGMALAQESKISREVCILSDFKVRQTDTMKYLCEIMHMHLLVEADNALIRTILYVIHIKPVYFQRGENEVATVSYAYTVKSTESGSVITKASALERHYFSPFNVKGGHSKLKAR